MYHKTNVKGKSKIPNVEFQISSRDRFEPAAQQAAKDGGVSGKAVTPFLLQKILELTDGASLKTNIALVENNARLAAQIARAL